MSPEYQKLLEAGFLALLGSLLMGRTLKRLILLPFEYLAKRTSNTIDDQIIADAEQDAGIEPTQFADNKIDGDKNDAEDKK